MANLFHRPVMNKTREVRVLSTAAASWLVPAQSGFVMADMKDWSKILGVGGKTCILLKYPEEVTSK